MHTLQFTDAQMQVLNAALVELPFRISAPLITYINQQLQAAHDAAAAAAADARDMPSGSTKEPDPYSGS